MSLITILWSMIVSACLTLGWMHLLLWFRDRQARANLIFFITALSAAGTAAFELALMRSHTPEEYGFLMRWVQIPITGLILSLVAFVHYHFRTGRPWMAWTITVLRLLAFIINFLSPVSIQYREITSLRPIQFLGETVMTVNAATNPWVILGQVANILMVIYFADAAITLLRRGARRQAIVAAIITIMASLPVLQAIVIIWGIVHMPFMIAGCYLGIAAAASYELSADVMLAGWLLRQVNTQKNRLRDTEQRMDMAANAADVGMWVWDIAQDDFWMNEKGRELFGFALAEKLAFSRFLEAVHPEDREAVRQTIHRHLAQGGDYEAEYRILRKDGSVRWFTGRRRVEMDGDGHPVRLIGVSLDITPRRLAELELQQQRRELAHLARVTTMGELSGSLAHELNQPLTAILSNAQAVQRFLKNGNAEPGEVEAILEDIVAQNRRAGDVIHRLRLLFKKSDATEQSVNINDVVQDVAKLMRGDLVDHGVKLDMQLGDIPAAVTGDRVQLQQVLLNLMLNACDAMEACPPRERRLLIRTAPEKDGGVTVSVQDVGCGIPADMRERIFDSFYTTKKNGMGLGLSVCRTIIAAHRGKLWAAANEGPGATFHFTLPAEAKKTA